MEPDRRRFPDRLLLPLAFDAALLQRDLEALASGAWIDHFVRQNYEGAWSVIPLRAKAGATHPVMMIFSDPSATTFEDTPLLGACPNIRAALARFACPLLAVRLMRLGPGSSIREHRDHDLGFEDGVVRIHVPIATNAEVDFRLNGRRVLMAPGSAWYLRLSDPHSVVNRGATSRIHLVIDAVANAWIAALLHEAARAGPAEEAGRDGPLASGAPPGREALERFRALVLDDDALRATLGAHEDTEAFIAAVVEIGRGRGLVFSGEDARDAMRDAWRTVFARSIVA
jgi:hypothetical protein